MTLREQKQLEIKELRSRANGYSPSIFARLFGLFVFIIPFAIYYYRDNTYVNYCLNTVFDFIVGIIKAIVPDQFDLFSPISSLISISFLVLNIS